LGTGADVRTISFGEIALVPLNRGHLFASLDGARSRGPNPGDRCRCGHAPRDQCAGEDDPGPSQTSTAVNGGGQSAGPEAFDCGDRSFDLVKRRCREIGYGDVLGEYPEVGQGRSGRGPKPGQALVGTGDPVRSKTGKVTV